MALLRNAGKGLGYFVRCRAGCVGLAVGLAIWLWLGAGCQTVTLAPTQPVVVASPTVEDLLPTAMPEAQPTASVPDMPLPPIAMDYRPQPGEAVLPDATLQWTFDQPMNHDTFSSALRITPPLDGVFEWRGDQTVVFNPISLMPGVRYAVSLGTGLEAQTGVPLGQGLNYTFSVLSPLQATRIVPSPGATELRSDVPVVLEFNYAMVPVDCVGRQNTLPPDCPQLPLTFIPNAMGRGYWASTSRYVYEPVTGFAAGRLHEVALGMEVQSLEGATLSEPLVWSFETAVPQVERVAPGPGATQVPLDTVIEIGFNTPMDRSVTASKLTVSTQEGQVIPGTVVWKDGGATLVFMPLEALGLDTVYQVRIGSGARAESSAPLIPPEPWGFRTVSGPRLIRYTPGDDVTDVGVAAPVQLTFSGEIAETSLKAGVVVTSEEGLQDVFGVYDEAAAVYSLAWTRKPQTEYCVSLSPDISDVYGNSMETSTVFCFRTGDLPPLVELVSGGDPVGLMTDRPSELEYLVRNVDELVFELSEVAIPALVQRRVEEEDVLRTWTESFEVLPNTFATATVPLSRLGGALPTGMYLVGWRASESSDYEQIVPVAVVDRYVLIKSTEQEALVWVTDLETGEPISRTQVQLLDREGLLVGGGTTDPDGLVRMSIADSGNGSLEGPLAAVTGSPGEEGFGIALTTWHEAASLCESSSCAYLDAQGPYRAFLVSDRPLYSPGQVVNVAGIVREAREGQLLLASTALTATLELRDPAGQLIDQHLVAVSEKGVYSSSLLLAESLVPGTYMLSALLAPPGASEAEEYAALPMEVARHGEPHLAVSVTPQIGDVLQHSDVIVSIDTVDNTGAAVVGADVHWSISTQAYVAVVGSDGGWEDQPRALPGAVAHSDRVLVAAGVGKSDSLGRLSLTVPAELVQFGDSVGDVSQRWTVEAVVTDTLGTAAVGTSELVVHASDVYLSMQPKSYVTRAKERLPVDLLVQDWEGTGVEGNEVQLVLAREVWDRAEDGLTWRRTDTIVSEQTVTAGPDGLASVGFTVPRSGSYVVTAETTGDSGLAAVDEVRFWAGGDAGGVSYMASGQLSLVLDAPSYHVGDVAKLLIPVPFGGPYRALVTVEREDVIWAEQYVFNDSTPILEIPVLDTYVPNVYISCVVVKPATEEAPARSYHGSVELQVNPVAQILDVAVRTVSDANGPGETAELTVSVQDHEGQPVEADVMLTVVDQAVWALADVEPSLLSTMFYATRRQRVRTGDALWLPGHAYAGSAEPLLPADEGVGGALDSLRGATRDVLTGPDVAYGCDVADAAYWTTDLHTNASGMAKISLPMPECVTTWDVVAWAITPDGSVGEGRTTLEIDKPLVIHPLTPSYLVAGDMTEMVALVYNNTWADLVVEAGLEAVSGVQLESPELKEITVPSGGFRRVTWQVSVSQAEDRAADLRFTARSGAYSDESRAIPAGLGLPGIPIYTATVSEQLGFSGSLEPGFAAVEVVNIAADATDATVLELQLTPSLTNFLVDALAFDLIHGESAASLAYRVMPAIASYQALSELGVAPLERQSAALLIRDAVDLLCSRQNSDGGWGWWPDQSNLHLTSYVVHGLRLAEEAGFSVQSKTMAGALSYISDTIVASVDGGQVGAQLAFGLRVLSEAGVAWPSGVGSSLYSDRQELGLAGRAHLAVATGIVDPSDTRIETLLAEIRDNSVVGDSGVHWEELSSQEWSTSSQVTAVIVDALTQLDPGAPEIQVAVQWLLYAREGSGRRTAYEYAWAVSALAEYVSLNGEVGVSERPIVKVNGALLSLPEADTEEASHPLSTVVQLGVMGTEAAGWRRGVNVVEISHESAASRTLYYAGTLDLVLPADAPVSPVSRGVTVSRRFCLHQPGDGLLDHREPGDCVPVETAEVGQLVDVRLVVIVPETRYFVKLVDPYPAGFEAVVDSTVISGSDAEVLSRWSQSISGESDGDASLRLLELGERSAVFFAEELSPGTHQVVYSLIARTPGSYHALPAFAEEQFFPEVAGRTTVNSLVVVPKLAD